jgi:hypothetical protein
MWEWLLKNPESVLAALGAVGAYLGISKRTAKAVAFERKVKNALRAEAVRIAANPQYHRRVRTLLRGAAEDALALVGASSKSKPVARVVELLIDEAETYAAELILKHAFAKLERATAAVAGEFEADREPHADLLGDPQDGPSVPE